MLLSIPELALVLLVGPRGTGKSTFVARHFLPGQVVSLPSIRAMICDSPERLESTGDAIDMQAMLVEMRLAWSRLTVIDGTNLRLRTRQNFLSLARKHHVPVVAIVFDLPNEARANGLTKSPPLLSEYDGFTTATSQMLEPLEEQIASLQEALPRLGQEGFHRVYFVSNSHELNNAQVHFQRLPCNRSELDGPFDLIGDVHGCCDELEELLNKMGYRAGGTSVNVPGVLQHYYHPEGRKAVFLGDIVDRGPRILDAVKLVQGMVESGAALAVQGNHESKVLRHFRASRPEPRPSILQTLREIEALSPESQKQVIRGMVDFFDALPHHLVLASGNLVAAHAGLREDLQGRDSPLVRNQALFGDANARFDDDPEPGRLEWVQHYRGRALVVYGHTPVAEAIVANRTINIDTGCVFGGTLTALRFPEMEVVAVQARKSYASQKRSGSEQLHNVNDHPHAAPAKQHFNPVDILSKSIAPAEVFPISIPGLGLDNDPKIE